jgi:hypothetical protein
LRPKPIKPAEKKVSEICLGDWGQKELFEKGLVGSHRFYSELLKRVSRPSSAPPGPRSAKNLDFDPKNMASNPISNTGKSTRPPGKKTGHPLNLGHQQPHGFKGAASGA